MKTYHRFFIAFLSLCIICCGCGYHAGQGSHLSPYRTISIPYVKGDWDGTMTAELVKQVSQSGTLTYVHDHGSLVLNVQLIDMYDENVGFRYDRSKHGEVKKAIIPSETRLFAVAEVSLTEAGTGRIILGPVRLSADTVFDHDYYTVRDGVNVFSLGQVTDYDEAEDAAQRPLHARLASKIVDFINNSW